MKLRPARVGTLLAGTLALLATMVPTAAADTYKTITFIGEATLSGCAGLGYPFFTDTTVPALPTTKPGPKPGTVVANIPPQGNHCNIQLTSTACVKTSVGKKLDPASFCTILLSGIWWGYCGYSTGQGVMTITTPTKGTITTHFKFTEIGTMTMTGGGTATNIAGEGNLMPTSGSCANKTATGFLISASIVYKNCTNPGTVSGVCDPF